MNSETFKNLAKFWESGLVWESGKEMDIESDDFIRAADEAFDMLDMDGNGTIERGDIE